MRKIEYRIAVFVHLMKDIVSEQLDDVSVARFGPAGLTGEPTTKFETFCSG